MSDWITYNDFVDMVRDHHHSGFTGLVTGVSDKQHAFKIGFNRGQIVLLTYRIRKGIQALELLEQIKHAKITEYPTSKGQYNMEGMPDTSTILSQLTSGTLDDTTVTKISDVPELGSSANTFTKNIDPVMRKNIEVAAMHHFGPIGAMVCEELINDYRGDLRTLVFAIAQEVGADESDTRAFFESISAE
ncbi:MAG: hypothetical protein GY815_09150 [Gammaproteobacteria bacterium]|nr:hypothetical protein [Gammaproteobacteria bacterium]